MYLGREKGNPTRESIEGWRSSGVPGTVRGFELAHKKYGRAKWDTLLAPAIELASKGFPISYEFAEMLKGAGNLKQDPESKRIFLKSADILEQPDLARTLQRIAKLGAQDFYEGETAKLLAGAMAKNGGLITLADLKNYAAVERTPLTGKYRNYDVITAPPPSSGGIGLLQMMGMLEGSGYQKSGAGSAATIHTMAEVMRRFYADRSEYLGDPDFFKVPVAGCPARPGLHPQNARHPSIPITPHRASKSCPAVPPVVRAARPHIIMWWMPKEMPSL